MTVSPQGFHGGPCSV